MTVGTTKFINFRKLLWISFLVSLFLHLGLVLFIYKMPVWGQSGEFEQEDAVDVKIVSPEDSSNILKNMRGQIVDLVDNLPSQKPKKPTNFLSDKDRSADQETQAPVTGINPNANFTSKGGGDRKDIATFEERGGSEDDRDRTNTTDENTAKISGLDESRGKGPKNNSLLPTLEELSKLEATAPNNYLPGVKTTGNQTLLNTWGFAYAGFYTRIKRNMENVWQPEAIIRRKAIEKKSVYMTSVNILLDSTGALLDVQLEHSSGVPELDEEAIRTVIDSGPFPNPPKDLLNSEGKIYIPSWYFIVDLSRAFYW